MDVNSVLFAIFSEIMRSVIVCLKEMKLTPNSFKKIVWGKGGLNPKNQEPKAKFSNCQLRKHNSKFFNFVYDEVVVHGTFGIPYWERPFL